MVERNLLPSIIFLMISIFFPLHEEVSVIHPPIDHTYKVEYTPKRIELMKEYAVAHYSEYYKEISGSSEMPGITIEPKVIVVHYTGVPTLEGTIRVFKPETLRGRADINKAGAVNVGVAFVIDQDGKIYQLMQDNFFSRHCIGLNHCAIGIENVGMDDITEAGLRGEQQTGQTLTLAQLKSNIHLIQYLKQKYPSINMLIGHMEYRQLEDPSYPGHQYFQENDPNYRTDKIDPGTRFMTEIRKEIKKILKPDPKGQVFK